MPKQKYLQVNYRGEDVRLHVRILLGVGEGEVLLLAELAVLVPVRGVEQELVLLHHLELLGGGGVGEVGVLHVAEVVLLLVILTPRHPSVLVSVRVFEPFVGVLQAQRLERPQDPGVQLIPEGDKNIRSRTPAALSSLLVHSLVVISVHLR